MDIDRINSALRSQADEIGTKAPQLETGRRRGGVGFFGGFWTTLVVLGLLAGLYLFRPQIVDAAPQLARVLDPYARWSIRAASGSTARSGGCSAWGRCRTDAARTLA
jgi:hypothetical protein